MSGAKKVPLDAARHQAHRLLDLLEPVCERIEIAGSIRRQCLEVGDIELVAIPKSTRDLFGVRKWDTKIIIDRIFEIDKLSFLRGPEEWLFTKRGEWYAQFTIFGMKVDLFMTTPEKWGCIFMIRTGSADFTKKMVKQKVWGGYCPDHLYFKDGRLWDGEEALDTPEEDDVFRELGMAYVKPENRNLK
mgnify:CR=1 FL=1|jgi:DNA polymerase/3'-5' exonuclease PolX